MRKEESDELKDYRKGERFIQKEVIKYAIYFLILTFIIGGVGVGYKMTIGLLNKNADRKVFETSQAYIQGLSDDLAKYKYELTTEQDPITRKAIAEMIIDRTASLDPNDLNDPSLAQFLKDVRNGKYSK